MEQGLRPLPVLQNWDCHQCGTCCKEYLVTLSPEEHKIINSQNWDITNELGGHRPFRFSGWPWARKIHLNHRPDGACVFLDDKGLCLIQKKHGYASKPLPCRLFPWILIPSGNRWQVGVRFACPSAAENKGRPMAVHTPDLEGYATELVIRERLQPNSGSDLATSPSIQGEATGAWDRFRFALDILIGLINCNPKDISLGIRAGLLWVSHLREAKLNTLGGSEFVEICNMFAELVKTEIATGPAETGAPGWVARMLFRQLAALYTRKDHGPKQGIARQGPLTRLGAILRFSYGIGPIPRLHAWVPQGTFESAEIPGPPLSREEEEDLHRYYHLKIISGQFCGRTNHGMSLVDGFEALALTFPILLWIRRLGPVDRTRETLTKAMSIVDDHFGYNKMLGAPVYRIMTRILGNRKEIDKLIRWYSKSQ